jgi:hypothetical protein
MTWTFGDVLRSTVLHVQGCVQADISPLDVPDSGSVTSFRRLKGLAFLLSQHVRELDINLAAAYRHLEGVRKEGRNREYPRSCECCLVLELHAMCSLVSASPKHTADKGHLLQILETYASDCWSHKEKYLLCEQLWKSS